jgi:pimeloyl-ACP methyl ester carboxylesterase
MNGTGLMRERKIFIGGWSLPPELLIKCFGPDFTYIDCNLILPELFDKKYNLDKNWPELLKDQLSLSSKDQFHLAGWSTGAIVAFALSAILPVRSLTLISPTLSFCRRDSYREGTHPKMLRTMREHLHSTPDDVLSNISSILRV